MISIKNLNKTYASGTKAVDNLSLDVLQGEILALLGPNGAGKSSTIRVLTTLSGFDDGEVSVAGFNIDTDAEKVRSTIGYVAQDTGVDFFLTGRENLTLQGRLHKLSRSDIQSRIDELASYFGIQDVLDDLVSSYSGGMRRKLDIATALIHKPQLIFLDEPTLGLDTQSRQNLWQYIRKLNEELNLTILLTTHYLDEADKLASRVAIIDKGEIKALGKPEDLKDQIQGDVVSLQFEALENKEHIENKLTQNEFVKDKKWEQNKLHLYVTNGASCIPQLIDECNQLNIHVKNVSFARPSLDDVFIKITGASIEAQSEEGEEKWWEKWAGKGGGGAWAKKWQQNSESDTSGEENNDWQSESSKWSKEEQQQWWQQQSNEQAIESKPNTPDQTSADIEKEDWWSKQGKETNKENWEEAAANWSEEEQKAWWKQKSQESFQEDDTSETNTDQASKNEHWPEDNWKKEQQAWDKKN